MKRNLLFTLLLAFFSIFISCDLFEEDDDDDDFSNSTICIIGSWERLICDGTQIAEINFFSSNLGFFQDRDCVIGCLRKFDFEWSLNSDSSVTLNYFQAIICDDPVAPPTGGSQAYVCNGNTLTIGNTYTRR